MPRANERRYPIRPVVAAVVFRDDAQPMAAAGRQHKPLDATLCLSCGHVREIQAPSYTLTRMRNRGAVCRDCPPIPQPPEAD